MFVNLLAKALPTIILSPAERLPNLHQDAYALFCSHRFSPWRFDTFANALAMPDSCIATIDNQCAGYILASHVIGEVEMEDICVAHAHR
jgi:hypothetical protein